jgi:hypothetical protein
MPQKKPHSRTIDKINLLIRMELAYPTYSSTLIAQMCGINIQRFSVLKASPYYRRIHQAYTTGILADLDILVKQNYEISKGTLDMGVPIAMQALFKQAMQEKDLRVQNKAANDILDRHGRFAKVTRLGLATAEQGGVAEVKDDKAVADMLNALKNGTNSLPPTIDSPSVTETTQ